MAREVVIQPIGGLVPRNFNANIVASFIWNVNFSNFSWKSIPNSDQFGGKVRISDHFRKIGPKSQHCIHDLSRYKTEIIHSILGEQQTNRNHIVFSDWLFHLYELAQLNLCSFAFWPSKWQIYHYSCLSDGILWLGP